MARPVKRGGEGRVWNERESKGERGTQKEGERERGHKRGERKRQTQKHTHTDTHRDGVQLLLVDVGVAPPASVIPVVLHLLACCVLWVCWVLHVALCVHIS